MADTSNLTSFLGDIANAIRTKKETTEEIPAANFDTEILSIKTGTSTSDATATADEILEGKTAYISTGKVTGSMPDTGVVTKVYRPLTDVAYEISTVTPSNVMTYSNKYGVAFTNDYKHCARLLMVDGKIKLGLYNVSEDGNSMTLMKITNELGETEDAIYAMSGDETTGLINGSVDNNGSTDFYDFTIISKGSDINNCYLYIRNNSNTCNSIIPINFNSNTPIIQDKIFKLNSSGSDNKAIIMIPGQPDRCVEIVYINGYRIDLYLCTIDYENRTITRVTTQLELNARGGSSPCYSFSEDGRSLLISQPNYHTGENNPYAPYLVRFASDFNSWNMKQVKNGNPGTVCLNRTGTYAFTNGKLFSISYGTDKTINSISRVGTSLVINALGTGDSGIGYSRVYFSNDDARLIVVTTSGMKVYKIDLTGTTTATTPVTSSDTAVYFSTQGLNRDRVYACGAYSVGLLYNVHASDETKELVGLEYKGKNYPDVEKLDTDAGASDLLLSKTAYIAGGKMTGTMPNNGELNYTPSDNAQTIPVGYTSGGTINPVDIATLNDYKVCLNIAKSIFGENNINPVLSGLLLDLEADGSATLAGSNVTWNDAISGDAVTINNASVGSDNSVVFNGNNTEFDSGIPQSSLSNGYTIIVRIKPSAWNNYRGVYGLHGPGTGTGIVGLQCEEGRLVCAHIGGTNTIKVTASDVPVDTWNVITVTYDGTNRAVCYLNNNIYASTDSIGSIRAYGNLIFGKAYEDDDRFFKGNMSHCIVYNRALSESEIQKVVNYITGGVG